MQRCYGDAKFHNDNINITIMKLLYVWREKSTRNWKIDEDIVYLCIPGGFCTIDSCDVYILEVMLPGVPGTVQHQ
jgi:hypothetical protein